MKIYKIAYEPNTDLLSQIKELNEIIANISANFQMSLHPLAKQEHNKIMQIWKIADEIKRDLTSL